MTACHELRVSNLAAWEKLVSAYEAIVEREWQKLGDEPQPDRLPNAQGRTKFAHTLLEMIVDCSELAKQYNDLKLAKSKAPTIGKL